MKRRTGDRASTTADPPGSIHAPDRIGKRRSMTPEGFMLCEDVPIARTGWMVYGEGEVGVKTGDNGIAMIHRGDEALFNPTTVQSFNGKAVCDDHPPGGDVNAGNWKEHARGSVHNVRRGEGEDADTLRADLLITDKETIEAVKRGKVEVSAGYDANYETTGPGEGKQHNIIGNHVALVERGRCGPRCAIGDSAITSSQPGRKTPMSGTKRRTVTEAVRKLFTDASEAAVGLLEPAPQADGYDDDEDDEGAGKGIHVHVHNHGAGSTAPGAAGPVGVGQTGGADDAAAAGEAAAVGEGAEPANADPVEARFVAIEGTLQKILAKLGGGEGATDEAPDEEGLDPAETTGDEVGEVIVETTGENGKTVMADKKTGDSAALATSFQSLVADCEVLVPGFKVPTFDAKLPRAKTVDSMCALRRKALDAFNATTEGASTLTTLGSTKVAGMTCDAAAVLFKAAVGVRKAANNGRTTDGAGRLPIVGDGSTKKTGALSIAEINALNRTKYPV